MFKCTLANICHFLRDNEFIYILFVHKRLISDTNNAGIRNVFQALIIKIPAFPFRLSRKQFRNINAAVGAIRVGIG